MMMRFAISTIFVVVSVSRNTFDSTSNFFEIFNGMCERMPQPQDIESENIAAMAFARKEFVNKQTEKQRQTCVHT